VTQVAEPHVARNHALFREVNQRIFSLSEEFGSHPADDHLGLAFVCECANGACTRQMLIDTADYSRVRANPARFVVARGHEVPGEDERVVEERPTFVVVERPEAPA
jgi:hypothetical protein